MLQINGQVINTDDYFVVDDYDGNDSIEFDINVSDPGYQYITERALINSEENNYIITKIDGNSNKYVHVVADVDKRAFQTVFYENYDNGSKKLTEAVNAFLPSGWTFVNNGNTTNYRTLRLEAGTALDLLNNCAALYKVRFRFNAQTKTLTAVNPASYTQSAAFVTEELNLRKLQYYGDASDFVTRLEARGKDGMTFASINNNKTYAENYTYSTDIVYGYWKDERYTVKEDLLVAAQEKLAELAVPRRSYECDVIDLKSIEPGKYSAFDLSLYQRIALKDVSRETSLTYQVVKVRRYPLYPEKNVITLSTTAPKLTARLEEIESEIAEFDGKVEGATSWLMDSNGGKIYFIRDNDGNITSQVLKVGDGNNPPVWVFNKNGIGYSASGISGTPAVAIKANGEIVADFVTTGKIQGGHISGTDYKTVIDLDNGTIDIKNSSGTTVFSFDGSTLAINGQITSTSGSIGGWNMSNNTLWAGTDSSNPKAAMRSDNGKFIMGKMTLYGNMSDSSVVCPFIESTASNGDLMLVVGDLFSSGIAFGHPISNGYRVTAKLYADFDGSSHSKLQVNYIDLSTEGLRALKTALAGV